MIVPINVAISAQGPTLPPQLAKFGTDELVLIELQGALEVEGQTAGQLVGKLDLETDPKKPTLLIGHHLLEGKLVNLAKPLGVMHKTSGKFDEGVDALHEVGSSPPPEWDIVAVVRRKMVFAKRPMPMVGRVPATTNTIR
ncbi:Ctf8-domain-containing protein [Cytidiella melzeri]|nr:Ctf8-domain-containing protein [Cytidiella melzeri]